MAERLIAAVLKTAVCDEQTGGSNPSPSALAHLVQYGGLFILKCPVRNKNNASQRMIR